MATTSQLANRNRRPVDEVGLCTGQRVAALGDHIVGKAERYRARVIEAPNLLLTKLHVQRGKVVGKLLSRSRPDDRQRALCEHPSDGDLAGRVASLLSDRQHGIDCRRLALVALVMDDDAQPLRSTGFTLAELAGQ